MSLKLRVGNTLRVSYSLDVAGSIRPYPPRRPRTSGIRTHSIRYSDQESSILSAFLRYFNDVTTNAVQNSCGRGASVGPRTRRYACFLVPRCLSARGCVLRSSLIARCLGHDAALDLWNVRTVDPLQLLTILQRQGVPGTISANGHGEAPSSSSSSSSRSRSTSSAGPGGGPPGER